MTRRRFIGSAAAMLTSAGFAETSVGSFVHTFDKEYFIDWAKSTLNLIGVFTGHVHRAMSTRESGQNMFSVPACQSPRTYLDVTIL